MYTDSCPSSLLTLETLVQTLRCSEDTDDIYSVIMARQGGSEMGFVLYNAHFSQVEEAVSGRRAVVPEGQR